MCGNNNNNNNNNTAIPVVSAEISLRSNLLTTNTLNVGTTNDNNLHNRLIFWCKGFKPNLSNIAQMLCVYFAWCRV